MWQMENGGHYDGDSKEPENQFASISDDFWSAIVTMAKDANQWWSPLDHHRPTMTTTAAPTMTTTASNNDTTHTKPHAEMNMGMNGWFDWLDGILETIGQEEFLCSIFDQIPFDESLDLGSTDWQRAVLERDDWEMGCRNNFLM